MGSGNDFGDQGPVLDVEVYEDAAASDVEDFAQSREFLVGEWIFDATVAIPQMQCGEFTGGKFFNCRIAPRHALERVIVTKKEFAIGAAAHVDLDDIMATGNGSLDGADAILRCITPDAAMGDNGAISIGIGHEMLVVHTCVFRTV